MQEMQKPEERPTNVRLESLEQRLDSLEQVGKQGLPAVRLAGIEFRLDNVEENLRDIKNDMRDFKVDVNRRFGEVNTRIESSTNRLSTLLGVYTGIIALAVILSQLFLP